MSVDVKRAVFDEVRIIKRAALATGGMDPAKAAKVGLTQAEVDVIERAWNGQPSLPAWVTSAYQDIGLQEIPGKRHAPRILQMLKQIGAPFTDDETPWCGTAMAAWFTQVGIAPPASPWRALNWPTWGEACAPQLGAVGVKSRVGGGHVFLIVGVTAKGAYKALGANQANAVNIMDISAGDVLATRWPTGVPQPKLSLPVMAAGIISRNEA